MEAKHLGCYSHDIYKSIALRHVRGKSKRLCSLVCLKYKLIKDLVRHILSRCDVHNGLYCNDEFFEKVLMFLRAVAHWETGLHGVELVPGLDLRRGQCHRRAMMNSVEGDFLNMGQNVLEASVDEGTPSIDGVGGRICRQSGLAIVGTKRLSR